MFRCCWFLGVDLWLHIVGCIWLVEFCSFVWSMLLALFCCFVMRWFSLAAALFCFVLAWRFGFIGALSRALWLHFVGCMLSVKCCLIGFGLSVGAFTLLLPFGYET